MNLSIKILTVMTLFLLTGCITPKPDAMKREVSSFTVPQLPQDNQAMVYVVRPATLGTLVEFDVFVDGKEEKSKVGHTKGKEYIYFGLSTGKHQILSKAKNWATLEIDAKNKELIFLEQQPSSGFPLPSNQLIKLPQYEGKYHVKHLKRGTIKE